MPGPQDKTVSILGASVVVASVRFTRETALVDDVPTAQIHAHAVGTATRSDGATDDARVSWVVSGAVETAVLNLMDGQALTKLRQKLGTEAP